jgi:hypothetical protein
MSAIHGTKPHAGAALQHSLLSIALQARTDLAALSGDGADHKIHRLRLRMKKLQALLPLLATNVSPTTRVALRECIRLIKRSLSRHRDQQAMTKLIATLDADHPKRFKRNEGTPPVKSLTESQLSTLSRMLSSLTTKLQHLNLAELTAQQITAAHLTTQALVRKHFQDCQEHPSSKRLHRWRKSVKHLYFQSLFLHCPGPQVILVSRLDHILGKLHDHALLKQRHHVSAELKRTMKERIQQLRANALQKARQLLTAKPALLMHPLHTP